MLHYIRLLWLLGLLWGCSCGEQQPAATAPPTSSASAQVPADFWPFYRQFHADSLFQIQHISWPLAGHTTKADAEGNLIPVATYWEKERWRFQRPVDFGQGEFRQRLLAVEDRYVVEFISYAAANQYALERRFMRRSDGSWELVYYADMQER